LLIHAFGESSGNQPVSVSSQVNYFKL